MDEIKTKEYQMPYLYNKKIKEKENEFMIKIGIDFDDVLAPYVQVCINLQNKDYGTNYVLSDINKWGCDGSQAIRDVSRYYGRPKTYDLQTVPEEAKLFMSKLRKVADVYIITAMPPLLMTKRAEQIKEAFPDFPDDHILMGAAKNLVQFDITLDDGAHNSTTCFCFK